jgi:hypothetical protein
MSGIMSMVLGAKTAIAAAVDAYFNLVTLLLPGDGTNGAQNNTFIDSSSNNFSITRNPTTGPNAPTQGTFSPFSQTGWSNYFNGSSTFSFASNAAFTLAAYDTFECWVNMSVLGTSDLIAGRDAAYWLGYNHTSIGGTANKFVFAIYNGTSWQAVSSTTTPVVGTWYHILGVKDNTTLRMYVNGVQENTATFTGTPATGATFYVASNNNAENLEGYVSNLRLITGSSNTVFPYSGLTTGSSFTVPTSALTAVSGTALLTCQSNRFVDNSSNGFSITISGATNVPSVQAFSPFAPTAAYSAATNGGSGYFDGTGDYLSIADNAALDMGASDFTMECFVYLTETPSSADGIFAKRTDINTFGGVIAYLNGTTPNFYATVNGSSWGVAISSSIALRLNSWNHLAFTRSGNTWTVWVNGASGGTATVSGTVPDNASAFVVGAYSSDGNATYLFPAGYISNARVVKGTAVYTAAFTPPTSPLTAITNTSLLLNFTNAGITDATAKNVLETVADAQISTAASKWGGGSIKFDGTGDYLLIPSSNVNRPLFDFGSGNWTVEFWVNWTTAPSATTEFRLWWSSVRSTGVARLDLYIYNNIVYAGWSGTNVLDSGSLSWNTGQWYHMAFVRSGNSWAAFRDGTRIASATNSTALVSSPAKTIGENINGYIDDFRVTTGYARYDPTQTTVTIPTAAFPLS